MKNQRVHYRTTTDCFIRMVGSMPPSCTTVLLALLEDIDIKDNCVQKTWPEIVTKMGADRSNAAKSLARLKEDNLVREVKDIFGLKRLMINPQHVWSTSRDGLRFAVMMYNLGSHKQATDHRAEERRLSALIDPDTGLMISEYQEKTGQLLWMERSLESLRSLGVAGIVRDTVPNPSWLHLCA